MPDDSFIEAMIRRVTDLLSTDSEFAAAMPDSSVNAALDVPGLRLPHLVRAVLDGYAERPALGQRAVQLATDSAGRTVAELLPRFETITYRELGDRVTALSAALSGEGTVRPGDRVCILGFAGIDYTTIDISLVQVGAVAVSLPTNAPVAQLLPIVNETEPVLIASAIDHLDDVVEIATTGCAPGTIVVFDYRSELDHHRDTLRSARARTAESGCPVDVRTLADLLDVGRNLPPVAPYVTDEPDPLTLLVYTSGSTGSPKGAMHTEHIVAASWLSPTLNGEHSPLPLISLIFVPMSHVMGRSLLYSALGAGGTAYFAPTSDLSTLLDDLALVRPTLLTFVPRIWDVLFEEVTKEVDRRVLQGGDLAVIEAEVLEEYRRNVLGGRFIGVSTGSAAISPEMKAWAETLIGQALLEGYGSTETGPVFADGTVRRPPVTDYKLDDVPELGYFRTDRPHPRGELLVKTTGLFPGYYKRPELTAEVFDADGFYRTGDIVAETAPDQLRYLDRRTTVLKLSQGEFVAVSKLEAAYANSPLVRQVYIYGNSARAYLLAVIVPTEAAMTEYPDGMALKGAIRESLHKVARDTGLQNYELLRDFVVETTPFTFENGLLTGIRKPARPKLKERYGPDLEQRYVDLASDQNAELRALRQAGADRPTLEIVTRAVKAVLGSAAADHTPDAHFTDLGGDSLSALTFGNLLFDVFGEQVPVGVIVSPATDLRGIADYIDIHRSGQVQRPTFAAVHGGDAKEVRVGDLTLDRFVDAATLSAAPSLAAPTGVIRTVLLTGATGFLGRYLALEWLERMRLVGGTVICLIRAKDDSAARARLDAVFDGGDTELTQRYRELAADHLQVLAGDKGEVDLGLDEPTWHRLAHTVDLIADPAALVNHLLPYSELFGPNVVGTAELIRLAITSRLKQFAYVSTVGVMVGIDPAVFTEDADIRAISPSRDVDATYTNGYGNSKWAGEVLLREAHDLCGLPVTVYRCGMILADSNYQGQLNVPDTFTRLILSLLATGVAPRSFYQLDASGGRQRAHYDGLPVDFIAEAIATLGEQQVEGFQTYHVMNPHDDGIGLDEFVDWLGEAGYPLHRVADYDEWFHRFDTSVRGLPDRLRQASVLPLIDTYRYPGPPPAGAVASTAHFRAAVQNAGIGPDNDIPHISAATIDKYATSLKLLDLV